MTSVSKENKKKRIELYVFFCFIMNFIICVNDSVSSLDAQGMSSGGEMKKIYKQECNMA